MKNAIIARLDNGRKAFEENPKLGVMVFALAILAIVQLTSAIA